MSRKPRVALTRSVCNEGPPRAAIYARVSSALQKERRTIEGQLRCARDFLRRKQRDEGWESVGEYVDDGTTGTKVAGREALDRCLVDAEAGKFDVLVSVEIDRLSRSDDWFDLAALYGRLGDAGVLLVDAQTGTVMDQALPNDRMLTYFKTWAAAAANRARLEAAQRGKIAAIEKGRKPAGKTPYAFTYSKKEGWGHDAAQAAVVRRIFKLCIQGLSLTRIAETLEQEKVSRPTTKTRFWDLHVVWRILSNDVYKGTFHADRKRGLTISVPPIVSAETWQAAQGARDARRTSPRERITRDILLRGLAVCGHCGGKMFPQSGRKGPDGRFKYHYYRCSHSRKRQADYCGNIYHRSDITDTLVWETIVRIATQPGLLSAALKHSTTDDVADGPDWPKDLEDLKRKLGRLNERQARIAADYQRGRFSELAYEESLADADKYRQGLERQLQFARQQLALESRWQDARQRVSATVEELANRIRNADFEGRQSVIAALIRSVTLSKDERPVIDGVLPLDLGEVLTASCASGSKRAKGSGGENSLMFRIVAG